MTALDKGLILAGIDGSDLGKSVARYAIWLSQNSQSPVKFLHTIEHSHRSENAHHEGTLTPNMKEHLLDELSDEERLESKQLIADGKVILNNARQMAEQAGLTDIIAKQRHGTLPEALADLESEIAMAVLGSKGEDHDGNKKGLGSQLEGAIRAIHSPVFIVKNTDFSEPKKLMFAYNGSPTSKIALEFIKRGTFCTQSLEVHLVSVQKNIADAEKLIAEAQVVLTEGDINFVATALAGDAMDELTRYQQENDIDTTAMGAFSHGKVHGLFFGSFTTRMLLESSTNFLLIR
ncbi:MAG: universal stress protein [Piscirickettsiaceae bacterium]|nr:universal stress protein [Piscirickettsiaceae bacterium]